MNMVLLLLLQRWWWTGLEVSRPQLLLLRLCAWWLLVQLWR